jgi:ACS family glucarate transporter-like MFS transporter
MNNADPNGDHFTASAPGSPARLQRPTRIRWLIFGLSCAASWLLYLHRYSWGVIRPSLKAEYPDLTDKELGWLDAVFNATYGLGQVPSGLAGDLLGPGAVLVVSILSWSACVAWLTWAPGFWPLAWVRSVFGAAQAGAYPNLSKVTRSWFPAKARSTVQGLVASLSGRAGGACASLVVATLLMGVLHVTWREALLVLGGGGLVFGVAFALLFRNSPREHPWANEAEQDVVWDGASPQTAGGRPRFRWSRANLLTAAALLLYAFASTFADQLYVSWIPQFLVEGKRLTSYQMGIFASLPLWGGALGGTVGGVLNDVLIRVTGSRRWGRSAVAFTGKLLAAGFIALSVDVADGRWVMVLLFACKFFGDWSLISQWGTITDISGRAGGTIFGAVNAVGALAAFLAGPVMGHLKQDFGWEVLFQCVAGVYLFAALCWLFIDCTRRLLIEEVGA